MVLKGVILILVCFNAYANLDYGEKLTPLFFGKSEPFGKLDTYHNQFLFDEDLFAKDYSFYYTETNLLDLKKTFSKLNQSFQCSDKDFNTYKDYIGYLFRISALSLLDSNLKSFSDNAQSIGWGEDCDYDLKKLLNNCKPKTSMMEFFKQSSKHIAKKRKDFILKYNVLPAEERKKWFLNFDASKFNNQVKSNLTSYCSGQCNENSKKHYRQMCSDQKSLFIAICNEEDKLFGASQITELYYTIIFSQAIRELSNTVYNFKGCIQRYRTYFKGKESIPDSLLMAISNSYHFNRKTQAPTGDLFDISSIKSFLDMGVDSLFDKEEKKVAIRSVEKKKITVKLKPKIIETIEKKIEKIKVENKKIAVKAKTKRSEPVYSYFYSSFLNMQKLGLDRLILDMNKLKTDYIFSPRIKDLMMKKMYVFTKMETIKRMKVNEFLGSKEAPVPVLFLKYLIDTEAHRGLFNIVSILGNNFFVINDIDDLKQKAIVKIFLFFDESENQWQLNLLNTSKP